ncbi:hypothetical protein PC121_g1057 [Phytophthora cactorum]|nr:hypothetical protein PC121_g1057 [Phytophthora cactorum]
MRANKLADDYSSFTDLRFGIDKHLGYGNLYSKAAKDLDEPFTVVEDLTKELANNNWHSLGDLVRRRALKVTKECTALTEQSCLTHHVVNVLHSLHKGGKGSGRAVHDHRELTKELHSDSSRADIKRKVANTLQSQMKRRATQLTNECADGKSIEFVSYKVLPFDVFSTAEATWKHFKGVEKHLANGSLYEKAEKGLDEPYTIIADFKKELYANSSRADIKRRATQLTNECSSLMTLARSKHHHVVDVLPLRGDIGDFEGLFQRLEDSYRMLDDVFMANEAAWNHFKGVEKHLGNGSLYEKAEKGLDDPYTLIADLKKELVVEQQQKVADNLRSLLRKRATHLAKEYSAFTDAANSGHYIDRALDFRGNIDFDGNYMEFFTYKEVPFDVRETTEVSWDHWKGMEKHIMGNGGLYQKTAKDLDQPYTIIEDFTKELRDENLT